MWIKQITEKSNLSAPLLDKIYTDPHFLLFKGLLFTVVHVYLKDTQKIGRAHEILSRTHGIIYI